MHLPSVLAPTIDLLLKYDLHVVVQPGLEA